MNAQMKKDLRLKVKLLKATQGISYTELAEYLEIKQNSFYCWLNNQYELSAKKEKLLREIIENL